MATISTLAVLIDMKSAAFTKGVKRMNVSMKSMSRGVGILRGRFLALGGAILGVAGIAGIGAFIKSQFKSIDAIAKASDMLGLATEKLIAYQHGAALAGVESESLTKSIQRMSKNISDANNGLSTSKRALEALGLSSRQIINLGAAEQFSLIADRLSKLTNQADRVRVAMDLFGRAGAKMLNFVKDGAAGLEAMEERAAKLGLTMDREAAAKIELANDAMTEMKALSIGLGRAISVELSPFVLALAKAVTDWGTSGEGAGAKVHSAFAQVIPILTKVLQLMDRMNVGTKRIKRLFTRSVEGLTFIGEKLAGAVGLEDAEEFLRLMGDNLSDMDDNISRSIDNIKRLDRTAQVTKGFQKIKDDTDKAAKAIGDAAKKTEGLTGANLDGIAKVDQMIERLEKQATVLGQTKRAVDLLKAAQLGATQGQVDVINKIHDQIDATKALVEDIKTLAKLQKDLDKQFDREEKTTKEAFARAGKQIFEQTRNPLERHAAQIEKLNDLWAEGAIGLETYQRAVRMAQKELDEAAGGGRQVGLGERIFSSRNVNVPGLDRMDRDRMAQKEIKVKGQDKAVDHLAHIREDINEMREGVPAVLT